MLPMGTLKRQRATIRGLFRIGHDRSPFQWDGPGFSGFSRGRLYQRAFSDESGKNRESYYGRRRQMARITTRGVTGKLAAPRQLGQLAVGRELERTTKSVKFNATVNLGSLRQSLIIFGIFHHRQAFPSPIRRAHFH